MRDVDHSLSIPGYGIFTGLYSFLLDIKRESGFYDEMIYVTETQWTNVFTLTRFIIHEFGIVGGATMMVVLGTTYSIFNRLFKKHPLVQVFILLPIILECFSLFQHRY
ncbi:hypothetical protein [Photobacterium leiognathi]|uniref:hypothetical protein n=1 Tax=Photobacterium leiognathi TaxID=553611 RepID=UPI0027341E22|nr:hypothetical protein [Photobacterium leiognathi]